MGGLLAVVLLAGFGFFVMLWLFVSVRAAYRQFRRRRTARRLSQLIDSGDLEKALRLLLDSKLWQVSVLQRQRYWVGDLSQWQVLVSKLCTMDPRIAKIDQETGYTTEMTSLQTDGLSSSIDAGGGVLRVWGHFREACEHLYVREYCDLDRHSQ